MFKYFVLVCFFTTACASFKAEHKFKITKDLAYGVDKRQVGDFYKTDSIAPIVFVVHAGGWSGRSKSDMNNIAESLASHGFNVFNINYRLAPKYHHPAPVNDLKRAIDFILKTKEVDRERIGLWGYSSGAHIALMYGLKNENITAIVSGGAPYDLSWYEDSPYIVPYLGFRREGRIEDYLKASPITQLTSGAPALFLYHGINDYLVEHAQMRLFYTKAKLAGVADISTFDVGFRGHNNTFILSAEPVKRGVEFLKRKL